ncbi:hypothetical protein ACH5RR_034271 [Cinchona calisaya]|uniref:Uncharacterized protein n=1 Tax=Cinchona calisaya TaxID=153742 RepID=A0ABD2YEY9_9GENT
MVGVHTCVDYALELLKGLKVPVGDDFDDILWCKDNLQLQLKFFRTFLRYIAKWSDKDKNEYLESFPTNIESALRDAEPDLAAHCAIANENLMVEQQTLLSAFYGFNQRISPFEGRIAETYNYLSTVSHPPISHHLVFDEFVDSVQENLEDLAFKLQKNYRKQGQIPPSGALENV